MANIVLTRIDNRLIHGQVTLQWCGAYQIDMILVANDDVVKNEMRQGLMKIATPSYAQPCFMSIEETIQKINTFDENLRILLLCENVFDVLTLVDNGVNIHKVNIGNLAMDEQKHKITPNVAVNDQEVAIFKQLYEKNIELEIKSLPDMVSEDIQLLLKDRG